MERTPSKLRFVRCPKCLKLIAEFAEVPVYQCGGCGTILRAKYHISSEESSTSGSTKHNSNNPSSLNNESSSSGKQMSAPLQSTPPFFPETNPASNSNEKEISSEHHEHEIKSNENRISSENNEHELPGSEINSNENRIFSEHNEHESPGLEIDTDLYEQREEEPLKLSLRGHDNFGTIDKIEHREPIGLRVTSEDDSANDLRSTTGKENFDSGDNKGKKACEDDDLENNVVVTNVGSQFQARNSPANSRHEIHQPVRETSLDSEDFQSVRNWMEPEDDEPSKSPLRVNTQNVNPVTKSRYLEPDHVKILKKVDELRYELRELFDQTIQGKKTTHLGPIQEEDITQSLDSNLYHRPLKYIPRKEVPQKFQFSQRPFTGPVRESETLDHMETRLPAKRHCRPIAGGSPFVVCCECLKLLQVPGDFLVSRRKFHKLQCGACSKVLLYTFRAKYPTVVRHPSNEVESTASHRSDHPRGDPFPYSEDHVLSFSRSDSTEAGSVLNVSRNSSEVEDWKGKQVKVGQLHRLLGYSSASELLYVGEGSQHSTPRFRSPYRETQSIYRSKGFVMQTPRHEYSEAGTSSNFVKADEPDKGSGIRRGTPPLHGLLKKGIQGLNHGLENVKLKMHSKDKIIPT